MPGRKTVAGAVVAALAGMALVAGPAGAATKTLNVRGGEEFLPGGAGFLVKLRFAPRPLVLSKGDRVRIADRVGGEPHTISFARKRELPRSFGDLSPRGRTGKLAGRLMQAHNAPEEGPPEFPNVMNFKPAAAGAALRADGRGDSFSWQGKVSEPRFQVTADKGTNLWYLCLIHPWMQGSIQVR